MRRSRAAGVVHAEAARTMVERRSALILPTRISVSEIAYNCTTFLSAQQIPSKRSGQSRVYFVYKKAKIGWWAAFKHITYLNDLNNKKETRRHRELSLAAALRQICSTRSVASGDASCAA